MKYYLTVINEIKKLAENLKLLQKTENNFWLNEKIHLISLFFDNKIVNKDHFELDYFGGNLEPVFFENEQELNKYLFNSLISFFESEADFLKNEVENFENLKNWKQS